MNERENVGRCWLLMSFDDGGTSRCVDENAAPRRFFFYHLLGRAGAFDVEAQDNFLTIFFNDY